MSTYLPKWVGQLDGSSMAGLNCTTTCGAIALDRDTLGKKTSTGAKVRQLTNDHIGGTNQRQVVVALEQGYGVDMDLEINIHITDALKRLDAGQGMSLAGQEGATTHTRWRASETFTGNHQWFVNERRKNSQVSGGWEHRIYDPLGDGRRPGIADFAPHGLWIPQAVVFDFARRLNVSATPDSTYVPLGIGKFYAFFTHDTEPHLTLHYGGHPIDPPVVMPIKVPKGQKANKRTGPGTKYAIVDRLPNGYPFHAYQKTTKGQSLGGSSTWFGNIDGTRWLHSSAF